MTAAHEPEENLRAELEALTQLCPVFDAVAAVSEAFDGVYLVGGTVRDAACSARRPSASGRSP